MCMKELQVYRIYISFCHLLCIYFSRSGHEQLSRKDALKIVLTLGTFVLRAPNLVSDLSLAPLLISRGIKITLPLFSCCHHIAGAYGQSSSLQQTMLRGTDAHTRT